MQPEELKLNVTTDQKELVIRTGEAEKVFVPSKVVISGTLETPFEYYSKRKSNTIPKEYTHLKVNYEQKSLGLVVDEHKTNGVEVTGTAKLFKDFQSLGINTNNTYTLAELHEKLKFVGCYFKDREAHAKIIGNLVNYKARVETEFSNANDFKGNTATSKATNLKSEIPLDFTLNMPVILGQPNKEIKVEVCIDASSGSIKLWLECISLKSELDKIVSDLLQSEVDKFQNEIVIVTVG